VFHRLSLGPIMTGSFEPRTVDASSTHWGISIVCFTSSDGI
jgi:hypothetical protein